MSIYMVDGNDKTKLAVCRSEVTKKTIVLRTVGDGTSVKLNLSADEAELLAEALLALAGRIKRGG